VVVVVVISVGSLLKLEAEEGTAPRAAARSPMIKAIIQNGRALQVAKYVVMKYMYTYWYLLSTKSLQ
jgi:hypothetical protein